MKWVVIVPNQLVKPRIRFPKPTTATQPTTKSMNRTTLTKEGST